MTGLRVAGVERSEPPARLVVSAMRRGLAALDPGHPDLYRNSYVGFCMRLRYPGLRPIVGALGAAGSNPDNRTSTRGHSIRFVRGVEGYSRGSFMQSTWIEAAAKGRNGGPVRAGTWA